MVKGFFKGSAKAMGGIGAFVLFALTFLSFSCGSSTYVRTRTLTPAQIDMSASRSVAISSTDAPSGLFQTSSAIRFDGAGSAFAMRSYDYSSSIGLDLSKHFNAKFITDIQSTGYFSQIIVPPDSDMLARPGAGESLGLSRSQLASASGINAVITTEITDMELDEYVKSSPVYEYKTVKGANGKTKKEKVVKGYDYKLYQSAFLEVELKVIDPTSGRVTALKKASDKFSRSKSINYGLARSESLESEFCNMLDNISIKLANALIPHYTYRDLELMNNDPELKYVSSAYDYAKKGGYEQALELFKYGWEAEHHIPSGYNAALLLHALGRLDEAVKFAEEVRDKAGSPEILPLLGELKAMRSLEEKAMLQL